MPRRPSCLFFLLVSFAIAVILLTYRSLDWSASPGTSSGSFAFFGGLPWSKDDSKLKATGKKTTKWIVVTSIQLPTEDVKRLASLPEWTVVVVGDGKTPSDWKLDDVHFLSIDDQHRLGLDSVNALPQGSYTRKNAGYLYAIANGAEWIYDTDDDNKPYGKGLDQFDYNETVSGLRFQDANEDDGARFKSKAEFKQRLFNPYRHFGDTQMWPRGFPLEYYSNHDHVNGMFRVCEHMRSAAVQQGIVHKDPDVDAIYRLLNADPTSGLNERFNKFAPPVTLAPGTYSPWNSQNTLFHKRAFFGLFLPTTVAFRVTDIWRSFFTQKLLHLIGESVSFVPVNAIQIRNAHDFLKDFKQEIDVYEKTGELLLFLDTWKCPHSSADACAIELAADMAARQFWGEEDARLVRMWIEDLKKIGYKFPPLRDGSSDYPGAMSNETRLHNCRPAHIQLTTDLPEDLTQPAHKRAEDKISSFGDIESWCRAAPESSNITFDFPSPETLATQHAVTPAFAQKLDTVLVISNNFRWYTGVGLQQRLYDPFFAAVFMCGAYDTDMIDKNADARFPPRRAHVNYIYMSQEEMHAGYHAYYCLSKIKEMRLQNVKGYFLIADDAAFNVWHPLNLDIAHHGHRNFGPGPWWPRGTGVAAAKQAVELIQGKYAQDEEIQRAWRQYGQALVDREYADNAGVRVHNASEQLVIPDGWMVSDWLYLPSTNLTYFSELANVFYETRLFHELVFSKFMSTLPHELHANVLYLWGDRHLWAQLFNSSLLAMHPVKMSGFGDPNAPWRARYCNKILSVIHTSIFHLNETEPLIG